MINLSEIIVVAVMIRRRWCLLEDAGIISDALEKTGIDGFSYELCILHFYCRFDGSMAFRWSQFWAKTSRPFSGPQKNLKRI